MKLHRLVLTDFRNYQRCLWEASSSVTVLNGPNGSGKTNLLEALSLLAPGRGLRQAAITDLRRTGTTSWGIAATLENNAHVFQLSTGQNISLEEPGQEQPSANTRRHFLLDGRNIKSQAHIAGYYACIWLTPQMDRLFVEGASGRRRFLDRLVIALSPEHAQQMTAHERSVISRNRLLATRPQETIWLDSIEDSISRHAVAATACRLAFIERMNNTPFTGSDFPQSRFSLVCPIAAQLQQHPALHVEDWLRSVLKQNRVQDRERASTSLGAHRSDFTLYDIASQRPAHLSSSGQQKLMLLGIILSHIQHVTQIRGEGPLVLLDEPLVHLDHHHRTALLKSLPHLKTMTFLTGTEAEAFQGLPPDTEFISVKQGKLLPRNT